MSFAYVLVEWMDVAVHYSTFTVGVLILGVSCPPVKWQDALSYLEEVAGVLGISVVLDCRLVYTGQIDDVLSFATCACPADRNHFDLVWLRDET